MRCLLQKLGDLCYTTAILMWLVRAVTGLALPSASKSSSPSFHISFHFFLSFQHGCIAMMLTLVSDSHLSLWSSWTYWCAWPRPDLTYKIESLASLAYAVANTTSRMTPACVPIWENKWGGHTRQFCAFTGDSGTGKKIENPRESHWEHSSWVLVSTFQFPEGMKHKCNS